MITRLRCSVSPLNFTAKVPYDSKTPLQAAVGEAEGLRPQLPENAHPKLVELMQICWDAAPSNRPSFSVIKTELEELFEKIQSRKMDNAYKYGSIGY
ncbi:hypothetical protein Leryth_011432 [Lithospermum erythrorhizon]|uniref:Serine-threonine/tyrosine-protein kinase catalytic domain-containing protein n=1 Tax=Lithospermum erythrorhizon TaxID=34254 RepID=A0AAV3R2V3_LITER|nr:hypothetical protein Leryth_011432 [Lithospermum erythrorhizon]